MVDSPELVIEQHFQMISLFHAESWTEKKAQALIDLFKLIRSFP